MLEQALQKMNLVLSEEQQQQFLDVLLLLSKWNKAYNLTAIQSQEAMLTHHVLDSLAIAPYVEGKQILDIGTGAGFPGVPLAIYYPEKHFVLLDSNGKKVRFLQQIRLELGLNNITPIQSRIEDFSPPEPFDTIMARALASTGKILQTSQALLAKRGRWLLMKGPQFQQELTAMSHKYEVIRLDVPFLAAERHLLIIHSKGV